MITTIRNEASEFSTMSLIAAVEDLDFYRDELEVAAQEGIKTPAVTLIDTENNLSKLHVYIDSETGEMKAMDWIDYRNEWIWAAQA